MTTPFKTYGSTNIESIEMGYGEKGRLYIHFSNGNYAIVSGSHEKFKKAVSQFDKIDDANYKAHQARTDAGLYQKTQEEIVAAVAKEKIQSAVLLHGAKKHGKRIRLHRQHGSISVFPYRPNEDHKSYAAQQATQLNS